MAAAEDVFGDSSLFEEFEREREPSGSFIFYGKGDDGEEDRSRIFVQAEESSSSSESDDDGEADACEVKENSGQERKQTTVEREVVNGAIQGSAESSDDELQFVNKGGSSEKTTTFKLNYERNKFKRYCNILDSTKHIHDEESPAVQMIFQNNTFSRKYRTQIEGFIRYLMNEDMKKQPKTLPKLDLKSTVPSCVDINDQLPISRRTDRMWQAHAIVGCSQFFSWFILDTLGWPLVDHNPSLTDSWEIPPYEQVFKEVLPLEEDTTPKPKGPARPKSSCWNCGGDHMLAECKERRNQQKINESRNAMMAEKQAHQGLQKTPTGRYHKESSQDPKFERFKPGAISTDLRSALGLRDDQLPVYIYKMRALGYPPGWMMEATDSSEPGLAMFGKDGNEISKDGAPLEDGEMGAADSAPSQGKLNVDKIIEYPGFSAWPPEGTVDECQLFGLPPLQPHQLKSTLVAHLESQGETVKRKPEEEGNDVAPSKKTKLTTSASDMDLDDEVASEMDISYHPPLPIDTPPSRPPLPDGTPPPTPESPTFQRPSSVAGKRVSRQASSRSCDSPSLEDLEAQYQLLQKKLLESDGSDVDVLVSDSTGDDSQESERGLVVIESLDDSPDSPIAGKSDAFPRQFSRVGSSASINTFGELGTGSPVGSQPTSPSADVNTSFKGTMSISRDFGTPILKRTGSVDLLPETRNFSVGIEDHIPFENLPDSTGTFEKMRQLIGRIRNKLPKKKKKQA